MPTRRQAIIWTNVGPVQRCNTRSRWVNSFQIYSCIFNCQNSLTGNRWCRQWHKSWHHENSLVPVSKDTFTPFCVLLQSVTETKMSSFWRNFHHWLHWKLSFWQLPVQPVMNISSKWRLFRFSVLRVDFFHTFNVLARVIHGANVRLSCSSADEAILHDYPCKHIIQIM